MKHVSCICCITLNYNLSAQIFGEAMPPLASDKIRLCWCGPVRLIVTPFHDIHICFNQHRRSVPGLLGMGEKQ